jgi:hypothetical protein
MKFLILTYLVCIAQVVFPQEGVIEAEQINVIASINAINKVLVIRNKADYDTLRPPLSGQKKVLPYIDFTKNNLVYIEYVMGSYIKCEDVIFQKFIYNKNTNEVTINLHILHFGLTKDRLLYNMWYVIKKLPENTSYKIKQTGINYPEEYIKTDTLCNYFEKLRPKAEINFKN